MFLLFVFGVTTRESRGKVDAMDVGDKKWWIWLADLEKWWIDLIDIFLKVVCDGNNTSCLVAYVCWFHVNYGEYQPQDGRSTLISCRVLSFFGRKYHVGCEKYHRALDGRITLSMKIIILWTKGLLITEITMERWTEESLEYVCLISTHG